jgi:hypothetical protein
MIPRIPSKRTIVFVKMIATGCETKGFSDGVSLLEIHQLQIDKVISIQNL